jgi:hypothetical protein
LLGMTVVDVWNAWNGLPCRVLNRGTMKSPAGAGLERNSGKESGNGSNLCWRRNSGSSRDFCRRGVRGKVRSTGEAMDEVIGGPGAGELHLAILHHGAGGLELVLITLHAFALDQVGDIEDHFSGFGEPAADFFIQRREEAMHLEADCACPGLALALASSCLSKVREIFAADFLRGKIGEFFAAGAIVDEDLQVHFGFAAEFFDVAEELSLVGPDGLAKAFVVVEDCAESEGKYGGVLETICDDSCVVDPGFLIKCVCRVMFADDNC